jgi:hypothetical protein
LNGPDDLKVGAATYSKSVKILGVKTVRWNGNAYEFEFSK